MKIINISLLVISYLSISHGWQCREGPQHTGVKQIDAGGERVVLTDDSGAYLLSDSTWNKLGSAGIKHVTAGEHGIFGVDGSGIVYKFSVRDFKPFSGQSLKQLDVGHNGVIVGVSSSSTAHCIDVITAKSIVPYSSLSWVAFSRTLVSISCNTPGCWGVNSDNELYFSRIGEDSCSIRGWTQVDSDTVSIEAGADGNVFKVDPDGKLYERTGITDLVHSGDAWSEITLDETIRQAAYDSGSLWLITDEDEILECSSSGWFCKSPPQQTGASQIDAGQGLVVLTDGNYQPYILTGDQWDDLGSTNLKHVSVGLGGIWGVDDNNKVYKYAGDEFILDSGETLKQLDAGGGHVLGVTSSNELRCLNKDSASGFEESGSLTWETRPGYYLHVSCSASFCWGINPDTDIYYATVDPSDCTLGTWTQVGTDRAVEVEVDKDGEVFIVNAAGEVYKRTGFSASEVSGTDWLQVDEMDNVEHATYDLASLWLMNTDGLMMQCDAAPAI